MKKYLAAILFCLVAAISCSAYGSTGVLSGPASIGGQAEIGLDYFYDQLAPYGNWVEFSPYGYVWRPTDMGYGWHPYSDGHWVWTDDGWTWMSDYDWGWIPFHYGRWDFDDGLGWFWVPDTVWGPAWVTWSWSDMYVGWAPLPPYAEFVAGIGIRGFDRQLPYNYWCFVDGSRFLDRDLRRDIFPFERNAAIYARAIHRENLGFQGQRVFNRGVGIDEVRRWTGRAVPQYRLEDARQPGAPRIAGDRVQIYRPPVLRSESARPRAFLPRTEAPQRFQDHQRQLLQEQSRRSAYERAIRQNQDQQRRLLEQSQQRERQQLDQQRQLETRRGADQAARERANRDYQARQQELQRQHNQERSQMQQRHEEERRSTQQSAPRGGGRGKGKD